MATPGDNRYVSMYQVQSQIDMTTPADILALCMYHRARLKGLLLVTYHYVCTIEPDWHGYSWWHIIMYVPHSQIDMAIPDDIKTYYHYVCTIEPDWHGYSWWLITMYVSQSQIDMAISDDI